MKPAVFWCGRLGRRVRVSFCGNACRECTRWRVYDSERAPAASDISRSVPCGGATSASGGEREASSFQTAFELFFGVQP
jgi:hypothetical protein